jgi:sugar lactone lactonase YvrE
MKVIEEPRQVEIDLPDAEALIKEARQRQRRRRLLISILLLLAMVVSAVSYALVSRPSGRARHTRASSPTKTVSATQSGSYVSPKAPTTLVVAPNGDLLAVDSGRDQILRHLPSGKFQVLAGDGKRGFSGDGGPAVRARINVQGNSGIAVAQDGTVYFSDSGNGRVREVLPDGVIKTIVGGGTREIEQGSMPALSVSLNKPSTEEPAGLGIGPNGELYVAANAVYRLGPDAILHWVVGKSLPMRNYCWDCNPGNQNDFLNSERLAFDGKGDLLVAGGPGWGLYEMTRSGKLRFVSVFRGDGFWGSLTEAAGGTVVLSVRNGIFRVLPSGAWEPIGPPPMAGFSPLDAALGKGNIFVGGTGVAVSKDGDIYVDTNPGNTFTSVGAILELRPNGSVVALWKS